MSDDIQCISVDPVTKQVSFGLKPKTVKGISKLFQIVVLSLMNVPGKSALDPERGGGIPAMMGINIDPNDSTAMQGEIAQKVTKTEREILEDQLTSSDPPEERLRELQIVSIKPGETADIWLVTLRIINELGQSFQAVL